MITCHFIIAYKAHLNNLEYVKGINHAKKLTDLLKNKVATFIILHWKFLLKCTFSRHRYFYFLPTPKMNVNKIS